MTDLLGPLVCAWLCQWVGVDIHPILPRGDMILAEGGDLVVYRDPNESAEFSLWRDLGRMAPVPYRGEKNDEQAG